MALFQLLVRHRTGEQWPLVIREESETGTHINPAAVDNIVLESKK